MDMYYATLTVWFEDPFWVGVYQREEAGRLTACRHVFGAQPRDQEVYQWLLREWQHLAFSPDVPAGNRNRERPKRRREAQAPPAGTGTKAQHALQLQREHSKTQRRERRRQRDTAEEARKFLLRQQKKKEKRRGH